MTAFRMKVEDVFSLGDRTVFVGELTAGEGVIQGVQCALTVDGKPVGELRIEGEVNTGKPFRDLWTKSQVDLTPELVRSSKVWLIST